MDREAFALRQGKNEDHECTNGNIEPEESSNAIGKELIKKQREIESVLEKPRDKLRARQKCAGNAQGQINVA